MKKIILGLVVLVLLGGLSWILFFREQGGALSDMLASVSLTADKTQEDNQSESGVQAQSLDADDSLELSVSNFLEGFSSNLEEKPTQLSFVYSNDGVSTERTMIVTVPAGFAEGNNSETFPVVFIFHGTAADGVSAAYKASVDDIGSGCVTIAAVAGQKDDGMYSWNANGSTDEDDLAFVDSMWNAIKSDSRLDTNRVYAYGHSVGSLFVSNILAVSADYFSGLCCYSSQLMASTDISNAPSPRNVVCFHGADDTTIPADAGSAKFDNDLVLLSEEETVAAWSQHNGCSGSVLTERGDTYTRYYPSSCADAVVEAYVFDGVGHSDCVPAVTDFFGMQPAALALDLFKS